MISSSAPHTEAVQIITMEAPDSYLLKIKTTDIQENELEKAKEIAKQLFAALTPYMPAAGLAAPQIGISRSVFIYSSDRTPENMETVINPTFEPIGDAKVEGWEGCLSTILCKENKTIAKVPRYEKILASYQNENGEKVEKVLSHFAAKVFQHEYDHLQGVVNTERSDVIVKSFDTEEQLLKFMTDVKKEDSKTYNQN